MSVPGLRSALRRQDGAAAVEFALLLPVFAMLTFGMISAGFAFHSWLNVTHGTQEASRFSATLSRQAGGGTTNAWLNTASQRAIEAAGFSISDAPAGTTGCVAVQSTTNIPPFSGSVQMSTTPAGVVTRTYSSTATCPGMTAPPGDYVQVTLATPASFNYILGAADIIVRSSSSNRFEAVSLG